MSHCGHFAFLCAGMCLCGHFASIVIIFYLSVVAFCPSVVVFSQSVVVFYVACFVPLGARFMFLDGHVTSICCHFVCVIVSLCACSVLYFYLDHSNPVEMKLNQLSDLK